VINNSEVQIEDLQFVKYIHAVDIHQKITDIAQELTIDYGTKCPMFLVVMNGAFMFAADLIRELHFPAEITFVRVKSYHGTQSTGNIEITMPPDINLEGRHLIIIEDIIDTGNSMAAFIPEMEKLKPASIKICAILVKPEAMKHDTKVDYQGFSIPNKFVVGYGLDYNGKGRNLKDIYQLKE